MRFRLSTRVTAAVVALLSLAALGSLATLLLAWHTRREMARLVMQNEAGTFTTLDLTVALLRQRGVAGAYIMDGGNRRWFDELLRQEPAFSAGLDRADKAADTPQEHEIIALMRHAFRQYDEKRDQVFALFDQGKTEEARQLYLGDASVFYDKVAGLCDELLAADKVHTQAALVGERAELKRVSYFVAGNVVLAIALGGGLVWFLVVGVFRPIHQMAVRARGAAPAAGGLQPEDDLSSLGDYLQSLLTEFTDVRSDLARSRGELQSANRLAALGRAVSHIAHEIRNPLSTIGGFARAIHKRPQETERVREHAAIIYEEIDRLERILTDIMALSSSPGLTPRLQPLGGVVTRTVELVRAQAPEGVTLQVESDGAAPQVTIDAERIEQILINLIRNAAEAMPDGGTIRIGTRACDGGAELIVCDDGPGMPPEVMARAFEAFYTTKKKGTGLGLAISRQIVLAHGGEIRVESEAGQGTTFSIFLPGPA